MTLYNREFDRSSCETVLTAAMSKITAVDFISVEYKGFVIQPYYISQGVVCQSGWCASIFDKTGDIIHDTKGNGSPSEAVDFAKELVDTELAKREIAPRFLAFLQQATAEGHSVEAIGWALIEGSYQFSENGFFRDSRVGGYEAY